MTLSVAMAIMVAFYNLLNGRIRDLRAELYRRTAKPVGGLDYDGLRREGGVDLFNVAAYVGDLTSHQGQTTQWLAANPEYEEPALSSGDQLKFWCRNNLSYVKTTMFILMTLTGVLLLATALWIPVAQLLTGTSYGYTGNVIPHHIPHLLVLVTVWMAVAFVLALATTAAMWANGRMNAAMTSYCDWESRVDDIAWHTEKRDDIAAELARIKLGIAGLRGLIESSAG